MKKKLKINDLKVQSFITELGKDDSKTVQGGIITNNPNCTFNGACANTRANFCNYTCGYPALPGMPLCVCPQTIQCPASEIC
jgi:hypothetical protein